MAEEKHQPSAVKISFNDEKYSINSSQSDAVVVVNGESSSIYIDPAKEKAARRKFDIYLLPAAFVLILLNYIDRSNLGNARVFGFEKSLGLKGHQFGNLVTLFFVPYIVFEVMWVFALKRIGPKYVIAVAATGWCAVTLATGFIRNYHQAIACRMLLGFFEAGVPPCFTFMFSMVYSRESTAKRVALINFANAVSGAFGGLLAYSIQRMGQRRGIEAWRWLFIIEGSISIFLVAICVSFVPNKPETAWYLTDDEKETMRAIKLRDAVYKGEDNFEWKWVRQAVSDPLIYVAALAFFTSSVAIFGYGMFLPTLIKGFGYNSFQANYLTIPVYAVGACSLLTQAYWSDRLRKRALFLFISAVPVVTAYVICVSTASKAAGYAAMFILVLGVYSFSCLMMTWIATSLAPDYKRSIGLPIFASIGNMSGLVSGQLYPSSEAPRYIKGNSISAGLEVVAVFFVIATWFIMRKRNQQKEKMIAEGATTNGHNDDRGLDFKYIL